MCLRLQTHCPNTQQLSRKLHIRFYLIWHSLEERKTHRVCRGEGRVMDPELG